VAGTRELGYGGDGGPALRAALNNPRGAVALPDGGFLIADTGNDRVRRVGINGMITTVAGNGVDGFSGDGGPATAAQLSGPFGVAPMPDGGFLIVDISNERIRRVFPDGRIETVAGNGTKGFSGDGGSATAASLAYPHGVAALPGGGFLIADTYNNRIRMVDANGVITTIVGSGTEGFGGDGGPAIAAQLDLPKAVAPTPWGGLIIGDSANNRIRYVGPPLVVPSSTGKPKISGKLKPGGKLKVTAGTWKGTGPAFGYEWFRCTPQGRKCAVIANVTANTYTVSPADRGVAFRARVKAVNLVGTAAASSGLTKAVS